MRTPPGDQRRSAIAALCIALIITLVVVPSAGALSADYLVFPNGTAYRASIEIEDSSRYEFVDTGLLGEPAPLTVGEVQLSGNCSPCRFNKTGPSFTSNVMAITFERGNYTVSYISPIRDNHLQASFKSPYHVNISLPQEFAVQNPLLAGISPGANVIRYPDNSTLIQWNKTLSVDLRFYDQGRESLLFFFLQFLAIIAVVMLLPFLLTMRKQQ
ncbi:MAG: DUF5803 family protein [Methanoregula sp.]|jgi:hypothetical protein|nr:DUF5803 family protein [Methanoregula sp.]